MKHCMYTVNSTEKLCYKVVFNLFMDGPVKEMKARVCNTGTDLCTHKTKWKLSTTLLAGDMVLTAENETCKNW